MQLPVISSISQGSLNYPTIQQGGGQPRRLTPTRTHTPSQKAKTTTLPPPPMTHALTFGAHTADKSDLGDRRRIGPPPTEPTGFWVKIWGIPFLSNTL